MSFIEFIYTWLAVGFITGIISISRKDFNKNFQEAIEESGLEQPKSPKLFDVIISTLFGYYTLYAMIRNNLNKNKK